jgi:hypothetical protein
MMEINRICPIIRKYIISFAQTFEWGGGGEKNEVSSRYQEIESWNSKNVERERCVDHLSSKFS